MTASSKRSLADMKSSDSCVEPTKTIAETLDASAKSSTDGEVKSATSAPKRKVCLIVSYLGAGFNGSAFLPQDTGEHLKAVENELFEAISRSGAVSKANSSDPKKCALSRSSRTDKGVNAAAATFGLKLRNLFDVKHTSVDSMAAMSGAKKRRLMSEITSVSKIADESLEMPKSAAIGSANGGWLRMAQLINRQLATGRGTVRVQGIIKTTKKFNAYTYCSSRRYRYVCPSFLFDPAFDERSIAGLAEAYFCIFQLHSASLSSTGDGRAKGKDPRGAYRISDSRLELLQRVCDLCFSGAGNFHNFTRSTMPLEARSIRFMRFVGLSQTRHLSSQLQTDSGSAEKQRGDKSKEQWAADRKKRVCDYAHLPSVFLCQRTGVEFVEFIIHGDSFMYHQIRKMMALVVCLMHRMTLGTDAFIEQLSDGSGAIDDQNWAHEILPKVAGIALSADFKLAVPLAPSEGLYLNRVDFDRYNDKCANLKQTENAIEYEFCQQSINEFISDSIRPAIVQFETQSKAFSAWLHLLKNDFDFECVRITEELLALLKQSGRVNVVVGMEMAKAVHLRGFPVKKQRGKSPPRGSRSKKAVEARSERWKAKKHRDRRPQL